MKNLSLMLIVACAVVMSSCAYIFNSDWERRQVDTGWIVVLKNPPAYVIGSSEPITGYRGTLNGKFNPEIDTAECARVTGLSGGDDRAIVCSSPSEVFVQTRGVVNARPVDKPPSKMRAQPVPQFYDKSNAR